MANQGYNWNAQDYAKNSQNQFQWAQELIPKLKLQGNEALLDIGCGDGKITAELARCLPKGRAVGVDSSEKMIKLAQTTFQTKDYPNLTFQVMDARKLTFQEEFDMVFSNAALHWIVDQKAVLAWCAKKPKAGRQAAVSDGGKGNAKDILNIITSWRKWSPGKNFS